MAKPTRDHLPRLLALELWGLGDLALALPYLQAASGHAQVTLLAKPHAAPLLARFAPAVQLVPLTAPWTAFRGKYQLHRWPWRDLHLTLHTLRASRFDLAVSARPDPRDHLLMRLTGAHARCGFARVGSGTLLTRALPAPAAPHRAKHWQALAQASGWTPTPPATRHRRSRHIVIHTGAGHAVREWPLDRFKEIAARLTTAGWQVTFLDNSLQDLDRLLALLDSADRFIGNDSGPGHLAAQLGVPTFTLFGPQLPELFAPQHPHAAWIEGAPCPYKPCFDTCRFPVPHCIRDLSTAETWVRLEKWLQELPDV